MKSKGLTKKENSRASWRDSRTPIVAIFILLVAITWLVFAQTVRYDFVNYDDNTYVYANPTITSGLTIHGILRALSGTHSGNWHPMTSISHMRRFFFLPLATVSATKRWSITKNLTIFLMR